jgi:hypothetical protein
VFDNGLLLKRPPVTGLNPDNIDNEWIYNTVKNDIDEDEEDDDDDSEED